MKIPLLSLCFLFFMACSPDSKVPLEKKVVKAVSIKNIQSSKQQIVVKDSVPPARRPRYMVDKSRPLTEMETAYPFDIDISTANGEKLNSSTAFQTQGKPTIVLFWLTTCYPCRIELAAIKKNFTVWQKETDFNLFAVSTDFPTNYDRFVAMVNKNEWPFPAFHDTNREFRKVLPGGLNGLPQVFVFNAEGEIVMHKRKYRSGDEHKLYAKVRELAME